MEFIHVHVLEENMQTRISFHLCRHTGGMCASAHFHTLYCKLCWHEYASFSWFFFYDAFLWCRFEEIEDGNLKKYNVRTIIIEKCQEEFEKGSLAALAQKKRELIQASRLNASETRTFVTHKISHDVLFVPTFCDSLPRCRSIS